MYHIRGIITATSGAPTEELRDNCLHGGGGGGKTQEKKATDILRQKPALNIIPAKWCQVQVILLLLLLIVVELWWANASCWYVASWESLSEGMKDASRVLTVSGRNFRSPETPPLPLSDGNL